MSATYRRPALARSMITGVAILAAVALSLPASAHAEGERVIGPISSVSGHTFEVARAGGSTTVEISDSTRIREALPAQRGEVAVGSCLKVGPTPDSPPVESGTIVAKWVSISAAVDGTCPRRSASAGPTASARQTVRGIVSSVAGNTITVTGDTTQTMVTVNSDTGYRKRIPADATAITVGKCVAARGSSTQAGVLQASSVIVWAAPVGGCPQPSAGAISAR